MSTSRKPSFLSVVPGNAEGNGRRVGQLHALEAASVYVPQQLGLIGVTPRAATLVSLGIDGIDAETFYNVMRRYGMRRIVDIRFVAVFRAHGFEAAPVFEWFRAENIHYERMLEFGNRFIGESANDHVVFDMYATYLKNNPEPLRRLKNQVEQGPLLLLGRGRAHVGSERDAIVQALTCLEGGFDLVINPDTNPEIVTIARDEQLDIPIPAIKPVSKASKNSKKALRQHKLKLEA